MNDSSGQGSVDGLGDRRLIRARVTHIDVQSKGAVKVFTVLPSDISEAIDWSPGAHVDVLISKDIERQYSLCGKPGDKSLTFAVLHEVEGRGGSRYLHEVVDVGDELVLRGPRNHFELVQASEYVLIAGGIGITPLIPMAEKLQAAGANWSLVYGAQTLGRMAFQDVLSRYGDRVTFWPQDELGHLDITGIVNTVSDGTVLYCCGPELLLSAVENATSHLPSNILHVERFAARSVLPNQVNREIDVYLDYSEIQLTVMPDQTIVDALDEAGIDVLTSCREGVCGTCETPVLEGIPEHRDSFLSPEETESNETMMVCISRAVTDRLVLDL